jgi:hypothetical protein
MPNNHTMELRIKKIAWAVYPPNHPLWIQPVLVLNFWASGMDRSRTGLMKGRQSLSPCWPAVVAPRISNLVVTLSLARSEEHQEIRGISLVYFVYLCTGNDCIVDSEDLRVTSPMSGWVIPASQ